LLLLINEIEVKPGTELTDVLSNDVPDEVREQEGQRQSAYSENPEDKVCRELGRFDFFFSMIWPCLS